MKAVFIALALVVSGAHAETPSQELARLKAETKAIRAEVKELKARAELEDARRKAVEARAKRDALAPL